MKKDVNILNIFIVIGSTVILSLIFSVLIKFVFSSPADILKIIIITFGVSLILLITFYLFVFKYYNSFSKKMSYILNMLSQGNLETVELDFEGSNITNIKTNLHKLISYLTDIINKIELSVLDINGNANTLFMFSETITHRINSEKDNISNINENMAKLKDISLSIKDFTGEALNLSKENQTKINESIASIKNLIDSMNKISQHSSSIVEISEFIANVAEETNLLALNASIEASRAGAEGAGFTIVASEIRELAENSSSAIKNIRNTVENIVKAVNSGVSYSKDAQDALNHIITGTESISEKIEDINTKISNQSNVTTSIHDDIENINTLISENSTLLIEMMTSIKNLSKQSEILKDLLGGFKYSAPEANIHDNIFGVSQEHINNTIIDL